MKTTEEPSFSVGSKYSGRSASPPLDASSNRTIRFDDESAKSGSKCPMGPETPTATNHRHGQTTGHQPPGIGGIHLKRSNTANDEQDKVHGFVDGNFASGKIRDLPVSGCYIVGYLAYTNLLAVGLTDSLDFYETGNYSLIQSVERSDAVSAIKWLPQAGNCSLLAVAGLDGVVSIYRMDVELLEMNAPSLMHEFRVNGQVRALDCAFCGKLDRSLVVAVGDKMGRVTFASYREDLEHIDTQAVEQQSMGILGLSICALKEIIAISTKAGHVIVHGLRREYSGAVRIDNELWSMHRSGPIRSIIFSEDGTQMALGGYDSTLVLLNVELWKVNRELLLQGTINTIAFDPLGRYIAVGCRDKTLTLYDISTYVSVKKFHTPGWVTSLSWGPRDENRDILAVRSERNCISILDLTPIHLTDHRLPSRQGSESSLSWSRGGQFIARAVGCSVVIATPSQSFREVASFDLRQGMVQRVAFCRAEDKQDLIAVAGVDGHLMVFRLKDEEPNIAIEKIHSLFVEANLKALAWSPDGTLLAAGGKDKLLHIFSASDMKRKIQPVDLGARVWDIHFMPQTVSHDSSFIAVALGDYTTVVLDESFKPTLQVARSRTMRCLKYHPTLPLLAMGDGAGTVAIVDYENQEVVHELEIGGRVNVVDFSPIGDYLVVGTDDCHFTIHETLEYRCVQEINCEGFALSAAFSPDGLHLAIGSADESAMVRLGPFLGIDLVPLPWKGLAEGLPSWARNEVMYRSGYGPSLVQRLMGKGGTDNLQQVAAILQEHPDAVYAFDRETGHGCFNTALMLKKPNLLKLAVTKLVDGTLDSSEDGQRSLLTTRIPEQGRTTLAYLIENYPSDFVVDIFNEMTFMKVPFAGPHGIAIESQKHLERGSDSYLDPWSSSLAPAKSLQKTWSFSEVIANTREDITRTPAVLPIPGLGEMDFLASLLAKAPPRVFDNDAMAVVLRIMWRDHIRKFFLLDTFLFLVYFAFWIVLVELTASSPTALSYVGETKVMAITLGALTLNSLFAAKELIQSRYGRRTEYFNSLWNVVDLISIGCVYVFIGGIMIQVEGYDDMIPLAVVTSLLLTVKLLSYLRGFGDTGWLVTVLVANFRDVKGFLIVLCTILLGFTVAFRLLFGEIGDESYGSLRRSFLSTFEMTILGSYDPTLLFEAKYSGLSILAFILAVTCVLVVALNALISILADSYARVQEDATANRRKEQAELVVEYLQLLPPWKRRQIEKNTKWFHTLMEVDADGDLLAEKDDWQGGLNALRRNIEDLTDSNLQSQQRSLEQVKADIDSELSGFKREIASLLEDLSNDIKELHAMQSEGGITFSGKNVAKAVKAVKSIGQKGSSVLGSKKKTT